MRDTNLFIYVPSLICVLSNEFQCRVNSSHNSTGSNSRTTDLLEILINGQLIGQGEVVVVNDNFGVRMTNVLSLEERLNYIK